eukprot:gi/632971302/ref/XP_007902104.1/ PREDICTED: transforming acidic coiled-coil-containing protein 2 isoform X4 [Callorhinchus milii]
MGNESSSLGDQDVVTDSVTLMPPEQETAETTSKSHKKKRGSLTGGHLSKLSKERGEQNVNKERVDLKSTGAVVDQEHIALTFPNLDLHGESSTAPAGHTLRLSSRSSPPILQRKQYFRESSAIQATAASADTPLPARSVRRPNAGANDAPSPENITENDPNSATPIILLGQGNASPECKWSSLEDVPLEGSGLEVTNIVQDAGATEVEVANCSMEDGSLLARDIKASVEWLSEPLHHGEQLDGTDEQYSHPSSQAAQMGDQLAAQETKYSLKVLVPGYKECTEAEPEESTDGRSNLLMVGEIQHPEYPATLSLEKYENVAIAGGQSDVNHSQQAKVDNEQFGKQVVSHKEENCISPEVSVKETEGCIGMLECTQSPAEIKTLDENGLAFLCDNDGRQTCNSERELNISGGSVHNFLKETESQNLPEKKDFDPAEMNLALFTVGGEQRKENETKAQGSCSEHDDYSRVNVTENTFQGNTDLSAILQNPGLGKIEEKLMGFSCDSEQVQTYSCEAKANVGEGNLSCSQVGLGNDMLPHDSQSLDVLELKVTAFTSKSELQIGASEAQEEACEYSACDRQAGLDNADSQQYLRLSPTCQDPVSEDVLNKAVDFCCDGDQETSISQKREKALGETRCSSQTEDSAFPDNSERTPYQNSDVPETKEMLVGSQKGEQEMCFNENQETGRKENHLQTCLESESFSEAMQTIANPQNPDSTEMERDTLRVSSEQGDAIESQNKDSEDGLCHLQKSERNVSPVTTQNVFPVTIELSASLRDWSTDETREDALSVDCVGDRQQTCSSETRDNVHEANMSALQTEGRRIENKRFSEMFEATPHAETPAVLGVKETSMVLGEEQQHIMVKEKVGDGSMGSLEMSTEQIVGMPVEAPSSSEVPGTVDASQTALPVTSEEQTYSSGREKDSEEIKRSSPIEMENGMLPEAKELPLAPRTCESKEATEKVPVFTHRSGQTQTRHGETVASSRRENLLNIQATKTGVIVRETAGVRPPDASEMSEPLMIVGGGREDTISGEIACSPLITAERGSLSTRIPGLSLILGDSDSAGAENEDEQQTADEESSVELRVGNECRLQADTTPESRHAQPGCQQPDGAGLKEKPATFSLEQQKTHSSEKQEKANEGDVHSLREKTDRTEFPATTQLALGAGAEEGRYKSECSKEQLEMGDAESNLYLCREKLGNSQRGTGNLLSPETTGWPHGAQKTSAVGRENALAGLGREMPQSGSRTTKEDVCEVLSHTLQADVEKLLPPEVLESPLSPHNPDPGHPREILTGSNGEHQRIYGNGEREFPDSPQGNPCCLPAGAENVESAENVAFPKAAELLRALWDSDSRGASGQLADLSVDGQQQPLAAGAEKEKVCEAKVCSLQQRGASPTQSATTIEQALGSGTRTAGSLEERPSFDDIVERQDVGEHGTKVEACADNENSPEVGLESSVVEHATVAGNPELPQTFDQVVVVLDGELQGTLSGPTGGEYTEGSLRTASDPVVETSAEELAAGTENRDGAEAAEGIVGLLNGQSQRQDKCEDGVNENVCEGMILVGSEDALPEYTGLVASKVPESNVELKEELFGLSSEGQKICSAESKGTVCEGDVLGLQTDSDGILVPGTTELTCGSRNPDTGLSAISLVCVSEELPDSNLMREKAGEENVRSIQTDREQTVQTESTEMTANLWSLEWQEGTEAGLGFSGGTEQERPNRGTSKDNVSEEDPQASVLCSEHIRLPEGEKVTVSSQDLITAETREMGLSDQLQTENVSSLQVGVESRLFPVSDILISCHQSPRAVDVEEAILALCGEGEQPTRSGEMKTAQACEETARIVHKNSEEKSAMPATAELISSPQNPDPADSLHLCPEEGQVHFSGIEKETSEEKRSQLVGIERDFCPDATMILPQTPPNCDLPEIRENLSWVGGAGEQREARDSETQDDTSESKGFQCGTGNSIPPESVKPLAGFHIHDLEEDLRDNLPAFGSGGEQNPTCGSGTEERVSEEDQSSIGMISESEASENTRLISQPQDLEELDLKGVLLASAGEKQQASALEEIKDALNSQSDAVSLSVREATCAPSSPRQRDPPGDENKSLGSNRVPEKQQTCDREPKESQFPNEEFCLLQMYLEQTAASGSTELLSNSRASNTAAGLPESTISPGGKADQTSNVETRGDIFGENVRSLQMDVEERIPESGELSTDTLLPDAVLTEDLLRLTLDSEKQQSLSVSGGECVSAKNVECPAECAPCSPTVPEAVDMNHLSDKPLKSEQQQTDDSPVSHKAREEKICLGTDSVLGGDTLPETAEKEPVSAVGTEHKRHATSQESPLRELLIVKPEEPSSVAQHLLLLHAGDAEEGVLEKDAKGQEHIVGVPAIGNFTGTSPPVSVKEPSSMTDGVFTKEYSLPEPTAEPQGHSLCLSADVTEKKLPYAECKSPEVQIIEAGLKAERPVLDSDVLPRPALPSSIISPESTRVSESFPLPAQESVPASRGRKGPAVSPLLPLLPDDVDKSSADPTLQEELASVSFPCELEEPLVPSASLSPSLSSLEPDGADEVTSEATDQQTELVSNTVPCEITRSIPPLPLVDTDTETAEGSSEQDLIRASVSCDSEKPAAPPLPSPPSSEAELLTGTTALQTELVRTCIHFCFRSSDSEGAFETPEETTPVKVAPQIPTGAGEEESQEQLPAEDSVFSPDNQIVDTTEKQLGEADAFRPLSESASIVFDEDKPIASSGAYKIDFDSLESLAPFQVSSSLAPSSPVTDKPKGSGILEQASKEIPSSPAGSSPPLPSPPLGQKAETPAEATDVGNTEAPATSLQPEAFSIAADNAPSVKKKKPRPLSVKRKSKAEQAAEVRSEQPVEIPTVTECPAVPPAPETSKAETLPEAPCPQSAVNDSPLPTSASCGFDPGNFVEIGSLDGGAVQKVPLSETKSEGATAVSTESERVEPVVDVKIDSPALGHAVRLEFDYSENKDDFETEQAKKPPPKKLGKKPSGKMPLRKPKIGAKKVPSVEKVDSTSSTPPSTTDIDDIPIQKTSYSFNPDQWDDPNFNPFGSNVKVPNSPKLSRASYSFEADNCDGSLDPFKSSSKMLGSPSHSSASFEVNDDPVTPEEENGSKSSKKKRPPLKTNTFRVKRSPKRSPLSGTPSQDSTPLTTPETPPVIATVDHATDEEKLASSVTNQKWSYSGVQSELDEKPDYPQPSDLSAFVNENNFTSPEVLEYDQSLEIEYMEKLGSSSPHNDTTAQKQSMYLKIDSLKDSPVKSPPIKLSDSTTPYSGLSPDEAELSVQTSAGKKIQRPVTRALAPSQEVYSQPPDKLKVNDMDSMSSLSAKPGMATPEELVASADALINRIIGHAEVDDDEVDYLQPDTAEKNPTAFAYKLQQRDATSPMDTPISKSALYSRSCEVELDDTALDGHHYDQRDLDSALRATREEIVAKTREADEWKRKYDESRQEVVEMRRIVAEYEKTIAQMIEDDQRDKSISHHTVQQLIVEKDQALSDLNSVEKSLAELFRRYEKMKEVLEGFRKNEEVLKKCAQEYLARVKKEEQRYQALKIHAEEKLDKANTDIAQVRAKSKSEQTAFQASLRKEQMKVESLERTLEQKNKEVEELTKICDELIAKMGKS